jgi:agmatine/peptidylarginine deiminase
MGTHGYVWAMGRVCGFLAVFLSIFAGELMAQSLPGSATPATGLSGGAGDVVILALEALSPRAELRRHVRNGLVGGTDAAHDVDRGLLDVQMRIVRETARFGPVLLLAPDEATKSAMEQRCAEFGICELLRGDRVRMKVVPHDGVWVRDFGPQIEAAGNAASVVHWRYFDIRAEEAKREKAQELETARLKLLETREEEERPDAFTQETSPEARKAVAATIDDRIYLLKEYSQILNEATIQRVNDESSAYDIADAVLAAPDFEFRSSAVALDGGNLFKLEDGRCLTTRVLLSRNKDSNVNLDEELEKVGGCKAVTFLEPLPGPVIEHIDLFALPVGGRRILLATYDLAGPFAAEYWSQLSAAERELAANAELAMEENAQRLRGLGYEVVRVPSPFPRVPANGHTYYPSVMNALVREGDSGRREVMVPAYKEYETDVQAAAVRAIGAAFGEHAEVVTVEATEAARAQGAIHCLTLTAPLRLSIFGDAGDSQRREEVLAKKEDLDKSAAATVAAQIPANGLRGAWAIVEESDRADGTAAELYPQRIYFGEGGFAKGVFAQVEVRGKYSVEKRDAAEWRVRFVFADQSVETAAVEWRGKDEVKLVFADGESVMVLRRVPGAAPFKADAGKSGGRASAGLEAVGP